MTRLTTTQPDASDSEPVQREELHFRRIDMRGWRRSDGLFEVEGRVIDRKPFDFQLVSVDRVVPAGDDVHDMGVRLVFGSDRVVREAHTFGKSYPYEECAVDGQGNPLAIDSCFAYGAARKIVLQRWPAFHKPAQPRE